MTHDDGWDGGYVNDEAELADVQAMIYEGECDELMDALNRLPLDDDDSE